MYLEGENVEIKQCMPISEQIAVEQLTDDDIRETLEPGSTALEQTSSRFYPGKVNQVYSTNVKIGYFCSHIQGLHLFYVNREFSFTAPLLHLD